jgi:hypothetical protein
MAVASAFFLSFTTGAGVTTSFFAAMWKSSFAFLAFILSEDLPKNPDS